MKGLIVFLLVFSALTACTKKDRLLSKAKNDAKEMIEKKAMDPAYFNSDIRLDEITPVYESDSLCILYLNVKLKNALGIEVTQRAEFVHFGDYWFMHTPNDKEETTVFLPKESFSNEKKGKIYENYQYDDAIYYRAALYLNKMNNDGNQNIPINTGMWELHNCKNSYNEETGTNYLSLESFSCIEEGSNDDVKAEIIVDKNEIYFVLWRKLLGSYSVSSNDGNFTVIIEDSDGGNYGSWIFRKTDKGIIPSKNKKEIIEKLKQILEKESIVTVSTHNDGFWRRSKIKFKMNFAGYNNARRYLK